MLITRYSSLLRVYFFYSLLLTIGFLLLLPRFVFDALRHGKYAAGFRQRLGDVPFVEAAGQPVVWLHCVSVGETRAARPVADRLLAAHPNHRLVVSTTTLTGQRLARELFRDTASEVFYFPFDWRWTVRRALRRVRPRLVLIMETELWANFLRECRQQKIPVALINGRISPRSMRNYRRIRFFMRRVTNDLSLALMQSDADAERIRELGLASERIRVSGNVKYDSSPPHREQTKALDSRFGFSTSKRPLVVLASTHDGEESLLLRALADIGESDSRRCLRVMIAPRHPERFEQIARLLAASDLRWARRSSAPAPSDAVCDAVLLDTIGELPAAYPLATLVFVGGSLVPHGGHNILEPAAAMCPIITGPHTANFDQVVRSFLEAKAIIQLPRVSPDEMLPELKKVFATLLSDEEARRRMSQRAADVCRQNAGATARTIETLTELIERSTNAAPHITPQPKLLATSARTVRVRRHRR